MSSTQASVNTVKGACGLAPETKVKIEPHGTALINDTEAILQQAVFTKVAQLWEPNMVITYSFFGGTENQKNAVNLLAPEWFKYAKLYLEQHADYDKDALIRITFDPNGGSWSSIGTGARNIKNGAPTMNLGWIEDSANVSANDRGTILHEWGHALGLMHEHQSRARGDKLTLKPEAVKEYYSKTQGWPDSLIQSQILDVYSADSVSNYSKLDTKSVMMYFMPGWLNVQEETVDVNNELSDMDKAYVVINYNKDMPHKDAPEWTLQHALDVAEVPPAEQKAILASRKSSTSVRTTFTAWNQKARAGTVTKPPAPPSTEQPVDDELVRLLQQILGGTQPVEHSPMKPGENAGVEHSLWSGFVTVLKNPVFQQVVSGVVDVALAQRGLNPASFPALGQTAMGYAPNPLNATGRPVYSGADVYATQRGLQSDLAITLQDPSVQQTLGGVIDVVLTQQGVKGVFPATIQQGLSPASFLSVFGHPIVRQALSGLVEAALTQRGLNPATTAQYPEIQQGVWSGFLGVLKNPAFQQVVSGVVGAVLTQRGLNPAPPAHGIFADAGKLLTHPIVTTTLTELINAALKQRGLDPRNTAMYRPEIQQGIWTGVVDVFKHPAFHKIVSTVISSTMKQHGINPGGKPVSIPPQLPDDVQQGIWSGIGSVLKNPLFQQVVGGIVDTALLFAAPNPNLPFVPEPTAPLQQHGLLSGIGSLVNHPLFREALSGAINFALTQRGLNPQPKPAFVSAKATWEPELQKGAVYTNGANTVDSNSDTAISSPVLKPAFAGVNGLASQVSDAIDGTIPQYLLENAPTDRGVHHVNGLDVPQLKALQAAGTIQVCARPHHLDAAAASYDKSKFGVSRPSTPAVTDIDISAAA